MLFILKNCIKVTFLRCAERGQRGQSKVKLVCDKRDRVKCNEHRLQWGQSKVYGKRTRGTE